MPSENPRSKKPLVTDRDYKGVGSKIWRITNLGWALFGITCTLVGGYISFEFFSPRIDATVSESPFPNNPFFSRFEFKNVGNFTVKDFKIQCAGLDLRPMHPSDTQLSKLTAILNTVVAHSVHADTPALEPGTSTTFSCALGDVAGGEDIPESLELNGHILYTTRFRYLFWPKQIIRYFSFQAFVDVNHHTFWTKKALTAQQQHSLEEQEKRVQEENPNAPFLK